MGQAVIWGALVAAVGAWLAWFGITMRRSGRQETALEAAERYAKTRKRMDDAEDDVGNDPDAARRWLSERGKQ